MKPLVPLCLAATLALSQPQAILAGAVAVDSGMPVFFPPLVFPPATTGGGVAGTAASGQTPQEDQSGAAKSGKPGAVSESATGAIVQGLQDSARFCASLPQLEYRVDCLSERLQAVAAAIPPGGDYAEARALLVQTSADLGALVDANASGDLPPVRASRGGSAPVATRRPLRPVATAALPDVAARATAILAQTQTLLLRSGTGSAAQTLAYRQIASAVGSTKLLLRSI